MLQVDPETIGTVVALFERYALGSVSAKDLAEETGLAESRIRMILMNLIYNGWIRRYRRSRNEMREPAPWRGDPPVSDELWARVEDVRRSKTRAGGPRRADRVDLLKGPRRRLGEGSRPPPWPVALDREAPPGECTVQGGRGDDGAAGMGPRPSAARA